MKPVSCLNCFYAEITGKKGQTKKVYCPLYGEEQERDEWHEPCPEHTPENLE